MVNKFPNKKSLMATSIVAAMAAQSMAYAQESSSKLEEVYVTATKRAVNLQDIPMSVTAVSGEKLIELGINNLPDLEKTSPGLKIRVVGSTPRIIMRGAGSAGTTDTAVPIYNDGLYRPRSAQGLASYVDVERVEVLRGPQGTLFGRNTLGGLLNVITKKPDTEAFSFGGAVTAGDYDLRKIEGFVNAPITDSVAVRVTATDTERDPYVENTYNSSAGLKDADDKYIRGQLKIDITEDMDLNLTAGYWKDSANGAGDFGHKVIGIPVNPDTRQTNGVSGVLDQRQGLRDNWGGGKDLNGNVSDGDLSAFIPKDKRDVAFDYKPNRELKEDSYSALFNWDVGFATLKANIGYADFESYNMSDGDFSIAGSYTGENGNLSGRTTGEWSDSESYQADINLTSNSEGPLRWTIGYYMFDEDSTYAFLWGYNSVDNPQETTWAHWTHGGEYEVESEAVYGQAEYDLTEKLTVTAGLRYSEDERTSTNTYSDNDTLSNKIPTFVKEGAHWAHWEVSTTKKGDDDNTDYRVAAQYNITEDVMVFASAATGYISGGTQVTTGDLLDPTEVDSYELGVKATLLDGAMTLNATYYVSEYEGLTTSILTLNDQNVFISEQVPGGDMDSEGLEAEMIWQATENLKITSALSLDNSEFGTFNKANVYTEDDGLTNSLGLFELKGEDTPFSPDLTFNLGVSYQIDLAEMGHVVPGIFIYYSDDYKTESAPYFWSEQDSYTTVDYSVTWYSADDDFSVQAYMTNATDEDYITGSDTFSGSRAVVEYNNPRTWGVRAAYNF